jgi:hypothetical protein
MNNVVELIRYISIFSVVIPLLIYLGSFKKLERPSHVIGILVIFYAVLDAIVAVLYSRKIPTVLLINLAQSAQFFLICWFYYELLIKKSLNSNYRLLLVTCITIYLSCLGFTVFKLGFFQSQSLLWVFEGIVIIVFGIAFFHYLFQSGSASSPHLRHSAWFAGGFIFYFTISTSVFVLFQYLLSETTPDVMRTLWSVHNIGNIVKNIAFAIGLYYTGISK